MDKEENVNIGSVVVSKDQGMEVLVTTRQSTPPLGCRAESMRK